MHGPHSHRPAKQQANEHPHTLHTPHYAHHTMHTHKHAHTYTCTHAHARPYPPPPFPPHTHIPPLLGRQVGHSSMGLGPSLPGRWVTHPWAWAPPRPPPALGPPLPPWVLSRHNPPPGSPPGPAAAGPPRPQHPRPLPPRHPWMHPRWRCQGPPACRQGFRGSGVWMPGPSSLQAGVQGVRGVALQPAGKGLGGQGCGCQGPPACRQGFRGSGVWVPGPAQQVRVWWQ